MASSSRRLTVDGVEYELRRKQGEKVFEAVPVKKLEESKNGTDPTKSQQMQEPPHDESSSRKNDKPPLFSEGGEARVIEALKNTYPDLPKERLRRFEKILQIKNEAEFEAALEKELQSLLPVMQAKRQQNLFERFYIATGFTSIGIPDDVKTEVEQLPEKTIKEAQMDKASQQRAEHTPTQTRHQTLNLALDTLRNQPPKKQNNPHSAYEPPSESTSE